MEKSGVCQSCKKENNRLVRFQTKYLFEITRGLARDPDSVEFWEVGENWESLCPVCLCRLFQSFANMVNERIDSFGEKIRLAVDDDVKLPTRGKRELFPNPKPGDDEPRLVQ